MLVAFWSCSTNHSFSSLTQLPQTNPGFNNSPFKFTKYSNAYMLVYIRESDTDKIICNVDEKDIAEHLRVSLWVLALNRIHYSDLIGSICRYVWRKSRKKKSKRERKRLRLTSTQLLRSLIFVVILFCFHLFYMKGCSQLYDIAFVGCSWWGSSSSDWKGYIFWSCGSWQSSPIPYSETASF